MNVSISSARAIGISLAVGLAIGVIAGAAFALIFDKQIVYGVGAMLFLTGVIALVMGLLGAVEPPEGWATGKGTRAEHASGRRSMAARVAEQHPDIESASGWALAAWGVAVGGPLIALSILAFYVSA